MRPHLSLAVVTVLCCALLPAVGRAQLATGLYQGAGHLPRVVTGLGFRPDVVLIKGDLEVSAGLATSTLPVGTTKTLGDTGGLMTDGVQSLDEDGFTVVDDSWRVNRQGTMYTWAAFKASEEEIVVGTYVGDGRPSRVIGGIGWRPSLVFVLPEASERAHWRTSAMPEDTSFGTTNTPLLRARILGFEEDGFRVGDHVSVNAAGATYHYIAFRGVDGFLEVGHYRGDGVTGRSIGPAGPSELVLLKANANTHALFQTRALQDPGTPYLFPLPHAPDRIAPLGEDRVQLGAHPEVNAVDVEYYSVTWSAGPVARVSPREQTVSAGTEVQLDGGGSTTGGGTSLTDWRWTQREGPTGVPLGATPMQALTLTHPGRYVFELTVTNDTGLLSAPARAEVVVEGELYRPNPELRGCTTTASGASGWLWLIVLGALRRRRSAQA